MNRLSICGSAAFMLVLVLIAIAGYAAEQQGSNGNMHTQADADACVTRGLAKMREADNDGAIAEFTKAIEFKPDFARAYYLRGVVKGATHAHDGAVADMTKVIQLKPDDADAYYLRGASKLVKKDWDGAVADFTKAIQLKPDYADAYSNLALAKKAKGEQPYSQESKTNQTINAPAQERSTGTPWQDLINAAYKGDLPRLKALLDIGADVNARMANGSTNGSTVLMVASLTGDREIVQALLDKGADVNATNNSGFTALMMASQEGRLEVVRALLDKGADVNAKTKNETKNDPMTALILASMKGRLEVVRALLGKGADVHARTSGGRTALDFAIEADVKALLAQAGAASTAAAASPPRPETAGPAPGPTTTVDLTGSWNLILTSTASDRHKVVFEMALKQERGIISGNSLGAEYAGSVSGSNVELRPPLYSPVRLSLMRGQIVSPNKITGVMVVPPGSEPDWTWELVRVGSNQTPAKSSGQEVAGNVTPDSRSGVNYVKGGDAKQATRGSQGPIPADDSTSPSPLTQADAFAYVDRAMTEEAAHDYDGAIADFTKAVQLKPDFADAYDFRAIAKGVKGDLQGQIADFTKAIEVKPDDAFAFLNRGLAKQDIKDMDGAIADWTKTIELKPDEPYAYNYRAAARRAKGDIDGANADHNKAIELTPVFEQANNIRPKATQATTELNGGIQTSQPVAFAVPNTTMFVTLLGSQEHLQLVVHTTATQGGMWGSEGITGTTEVLKPSAGNRLLALHLQITNSGSPVTLRRQSLQLVSKNGASFTAVSWSKEVIAGLVSAQGESFDLKDSLRINATFDIPNDDSLILSLNGNRVASLAEFHLRKADKAPGDIADRGAHEIGAPPTNWPGYSIELAGLHEVRVKNPNDFKVRVGLRSDGKGNDFIVSPNGLESVNVPNGRYDIYFNYSSDPGGLYQGDGFTLENNGVEITITRVVNGNYGIRKVK